MDTEHKRDGDKRDGGARANTPQDETEAAHRSGKLGADKPGFGKPPAHPARPADKKPNEKGPEFEEGGQYPGKRPGGK